jgi:DNA polymerase-3 subunit delta
VSDTPRVVLVKGGDPALVAQAVHQLVATMAEGRDPATCVEELAGSDELDVGRLVDALTTPPFLVDRRLLVVRDAGRLSTADVARVAPVLADLPDGVAVVFAAGGGTLVPALTKAVTATGVVTDANVGSSLRDRRGFVAQHATASDVRLDPGAVDRLTAQVGEDVSRVDGVLSTLAAAYGAGAVITTEELEPFLGATGSVPEWDLTDSITAGDAAASLGVLQRLVGPGGRAAPAVVSALQRHYLRLLRLDGSGARTKEAAAAILSVAPYPASKALGAASSLGSARIRQAVAWIASADADVKGMTALEPATVLEILVARLARLHRAAGRTAR